MTGIFKIISENHLNHFNQWFRQKYFKQIFNKIIIFSKKNVIFEKYIISIIKIMDAKHPQLTLPKIENYHKLEVYRKNGGYEQAHKALQMSPDEIINIVKSSGLKGRGGAGFPTGLK
jgi:hypothetical protein